MRRSELLFRPNNSPTPYFLEFLGAVQIPGDSLATIDDALQARFFQKNTTTGAPLERWELKEVQVGCPQAQLDRYLAGLGFKLRTKPTKKHYKRASWPGALLPRATVRLLDLVGAWQEGVRWNEIVVFGGKRPLMPEKENAKAGATALGLDALEEVTWGTANPQTELQMMEWLWAQAIMPDDLRKVRITFVDAPMKPPAKPGGPEIRPNTEDTIVAWRDTDPAPEPGSMLVSSGAPYGMAQEVAFQMLLEPKGHEIETFGHDAPDLPVENMMREVAGCVNRIRKSRAA